MRSVTAYKLDKIAKRNVKVRKEQAVAKVVKRAKLKVKTQLRQLEDAAFAMSHPVERLKKSPPLAYTRNVEAVKGAVDKGMNIAKEQEIIENWEKQAKEKV